MRLPDSQGDRLSGVVGLGGHNEQRWRCKWEKRGGPPFPVRVHRRVPSAPWNAKVTFAWPEAKQDTQRARRAGRKPPGGVALHGAQSLPA